MGPESAARRMERVLHPEVDWFLSQVDTARGHPGCSVWPPYTPRWSVVLEFARTQDLSHPTKRPRVAIMVLSDCPA